LSPTSCNTALLAATWRYGDRAPSVSQLVEKVSNAASCERVRTENPGVGGSIPSLPTILFNRLLTSKFSQD
jgi:hypothetical protein